MSACAREARYDSWIDFQLETADAVVGGREEGATWIHFDLRDLGMRGSGSFERGVGGMNLPGVSSGRQADGGAGTKRVSRGCR